MLGFRSRVDEKSSQDLYRCMRNSKQSGKRWESVLILSHCKLVWMNNTWCYLGTIDKTRLSHFAKAATVTTTFQECSSSSLFVIFGGDRLGVSDVLCQL